MPSVNQATNSIQASSCSARHAGQNTAPPPNPDTRAGPGNAPTSRSCAGGNGCSKSSAGTRTPRGSRGSGNHGACGDSWHDEARRRMNTPRPAPGQRVLHRGESGTGKIANAAGQHGTLERSLGLVTRDSPEGFVCSSSLRGIPPPPSRCLNIPPAIAISSSDRAHTELHQQTVPSRMSRSHRSCSQNLWCAPTDGS